MKTFLKCLACGWAIVLMYGFLRAETSRQEAGDEPEMPEAVVTEGEIRLPGVTIDRATLEIRIEAVACLKKGILEYVVCQPDTFEHEAIFTTEAKPELVHAALLLCGIEPTPQVAGLSELWFEKALKRNESRVRIEVEWEQDGKKKRVDLVSMLRNREKDAENAVADAWVFAGSVLRSHPETGERFYAANHAGILVGIWPDPTTVIQYGAASGNPYEEGRHGMEVNEENSLEVGTKVNLIFSRWPAPEESKANEESGVDTEEP